jgi:predicted DNA-binding protein
MTLSTTGPATRVTVRLPAPDLARIDALAEETGATRSEILRSAISLLDPVHLAAAVAARLVVIAGEVPDP